MITASAIDLAKLLRQGPFLDAVQQAELPRLQASCAGPQGLLDELTKRGWLTAFQAKKFLEGRGAELTVGPYLLLDELGHGGMGAVYRARHLVMKRPVALKLIRPEHLGNAETVGRFQREIQAVARLQHPHIVLAHDAGQVGDVHYLAMELLDGVNLSSLVRQRGPLPVGEACSYIRQAALALQHAHEQGLVHRDVKPPNLMLTKNGVIKLLDLGLARPMLENVEQPGDEMTRAGAFMGTPDFLAPEQAHDARSADIRADIYSLGCTLYFLLTAQPPFPGGTLTQKLRRHEEAEPTSLVAQRPETPPALTRILQRMMAKKPRDRFATPGEVASALAPFCTPGVSGPTGSSPSPGEPTANFRGSRDSSLAVGPATHPEQGYTLEPETPPTIPSMLRDATMTREPTHVVSSPRPRIWLLGLGAGLILALVLAIVFWPKGGSGEDARTQGKGLEETKNGTEADPKKTAKNKEPALPPPVAAKPGERNVWVVPDSDEPIVLDLTTKLGVKSKVTVTSTFTPPHNLAQTAASGVTAVWPQWTKKPGLPERGLVHPIVLELGPSSYLVFPLGLLKSVGTQGKLQTITLADGSLHVGILRSSIRDEDKKTYELVSVTEAKILQAPTPRKVDMGEASVSLTVNPPIGRSFAVFLPRVGLSGGVAAGDSFKIKMGEESLQGNLSEFAKIAFFRKNVWMLSVQQAGGQEQVGRLDIGGGYWWAYALTNSGATLVMRGQNGDDGRFEDHVGFTIDRGQGGVVAPAPAKESALDVPGQLGPNQTWALKEDGTPIVFDLTTKLGVKVRVEVKTTSPNATWASVAQTIVADSFPKNGRVPMLALDLGHKTYLVVPLSLMKSIKSLGKHADLHLRDGSVFSGQVLTQVLTAEDNKTYDLASVQEAQLVQAPPVQQVKAPLPATKLTLRSPVDKSFAAFAPKLYFDNTGSEAFTMIVDGEKLQGNLSDFHQVAMFPKGEKWFMTLRLPNNQEKTGPVVLPSSSWFLVTLTPSGAALVLMHESRDAKMNSVDHPGFVLEMVR